MVAYEVITPFKLPKHIAMVQRSVVKVHTTPNEPDAKMRTNIIKHVCEGHRCEWEDLWLPRSEFPLEYRFLRQNHEQMLLKCLKMFYVMKNILPLWFILKELHGWFIHGTPEVPVYECLLMMNPGETCTYNPFGRCKRGVDFLNIVSKWFCWFLWTSACVLKHI